MNRFFVLPHLVRVRHIDFPPADHQRLQTALAPSKATFLTPTHPEFLTDWMIDKELSRRFAPGLVSWAASDIVNGNRWAQKFWLANGLIANTPGGGGKAYSLQNARSGRGVLLHPEGAVNWQAEHVWPLHPGAADMALALAQQFESMRDPMPVVIVPLAWRCTFQRDVTPELLAEMQHIERECRVAPAPAGTLAGRLTALLGALLGQRARQLELQRPALSAAHPDAAYFDAQRLILMELRGRLSANDGLLPDDPMQALRAIQRGLRRKANIDPERAARDRELMMEYLRLSRLSPALYGRETITQEQIAEILKATRALLVTRGFRNRLHNFMPRAVAPRTAHIRVASSIDVRDALAQGQSPAQLTSQLHSALQQLQNDLGSELEPAISRFRHDNPMGATGNRYGDATPKGVWNNRAS